MKRITIRLPDDVMVQLEREADRHTTSISEVTRRALATYLGLTEQQPRKLPFKAIGASGYRHTARDHEAILAEQ